CHGCRFGRMERRVACEIERKSRLTDGGSRGEDDQVGTLPSVGHLIETGEAAGHAGDLVLSVTQVFDTLNGLDQYGVDAVEILTKVVVGDLEKFAFRVIEQIENVGAVFISLPDDLAADTDELALDEFLQDDTRVRFDVGGRNDRIGKLGHVVRTTYDIQLGSRPELFHDCQDIDGLAFLRQALHGAVDTLVSLEVETLRFQDLDDGIERAGFQHYSAEYGFFQLFSLGRNLTVNHGTEVNGRLAPHFCPVFV